MTADNIAPAFLADCLGLSVPWAEHLAFWEGNADRGVYNDTALVADYLVDRYAAGDLSEFPVAFAVLERCLAEGNEEVREVTTIGIIEGIQTVASHRPFGPGVFEPWLAPRSRLAWVMGEASWSGEFALVEFLTDRLGEPDPWAFELDVNQIQSESVRLMLNRLKPVPNTVAVTETGLPSI